MIESALLFPNKTCLKSAQSGGLHDEIKSGNKEFYRRLQTEIIADYGRYNLVYVTTVLSQSQWKVYLIHSLVAAAAVKRKCSPLLYLILFSIHVGWVWAGVSDLRTFSSLLHLTRLDMGSPSSRIHNKPILTLE